MHRLDNVVQRYGWGDPVAIWDLLGVDPPGTPAAELWMGAHPSAPSRLVDLQVALDQVVARNPAAALGPDVAERFDGQLPYLFKVLAAGQALSLQAHPSPERARDGYRREDTAGVPLDGPTRIYRDRNHKPELICAVTRFQARCGFRPVAATLELLDDLACPELAPLGQLLDSVADERTALGHALEWLLTRSAPEAAALVEAAASAAAVVDAAASAAGVVEGTTVRARAPGGSPGDRAASGSGSARFGPERQWVGRLAEQHPGDPGVLVALLLNHVELQPGEALFLGAGNLHCYLEGVGVEVMANSDNVVRGGLTSKHIDVAELLEVVDPTPLVVSAQRPAGPVHTYDSPVPEFALTRVELAPDGVERPAGPRIVLVLEGRATLEAGGSMTELRRGHSAWIACEDGPVRLSGSGLAYEVSTGTG